MPVAGGNAEPRRDSRERTRSSAPGPSGAKTANASPVSVRHTNVSGSVQRPKPNGLHPASCPLAEKRMPPNQGPGNSGGGASSQRTESGADSSFNTAWAPAALVASLEPASPQPAAASRPSGRSQYTDGSPNASAPASGSTAGRGIHPATQRLASVDPSVVISRPHASRHRPRATARATTSCCPVRALGYTSNTGFKTT
ncbi:hypothetical protein ACN28S_20575 [Cystobacter fuscus]